MADYSVVGKRLPRVEGPAKATGSCRFTGDISLPRQLYGRMLPSPHAHARIVGVDISRAERLLGVKAVITGEATGGRRYGYTPDMTDQYMLAVGRVRYIGEPVAAVAAIDQDTAREALELIRVEYEALPAVFDMEEAMRTGAPGVHDVESNISRTVEEGFGDVDRAFGESYYTRQDVFTTQALSVAALEPHASLASLNPEGGLTVWAATQGPFKLRKHLAGVLGMDESLLRIIKPAVGGGFCGKSALFPHDFCAAVLTLKTGRPVKMVLTREEVFVNCGGRMPMTITLKTGVQRDGRLLAMEATVVADNGAYNRGSLTPIMLAGTMMNLPYRLPNVRYTGHLVYTNNAPTGVQRGAGNPQIRFAIESQLDMIAEELGLDAKEIRLSSALQPGDVTANGFQIKSCALDRCIEQVCERHEWGARRGVDDGGRAGARRSQGAGRPANAGTAERAAGPDPWRSGVGLACGDHNVSSRNGPHDSSMALVKLDPSGGATVYSGAADIGQGSDTTLCQIASEELGLPMDRVRLVTGDTEATPLDLGTFGSRVTMIGGSAVKAAAADARGQLLEAAAEVLEARAGDLEAWDGSIFVKGSPDRSISFSQAVEAALARKTAVLGRGLYDPPTEKREPVRGGNSSPGYTFGAQVAEVEVDLETGQVELGTLTAAQDVGFAINPMGAEGQVEGSVSNGLGQARWEDLARRDGAILNPSFVDYRLPTALDMPPIAAILVEAPDPVGPYGAKGMAEGGLTPTVPAVTNALYHATGIRLMSLPATPERVLGEG